MRLESLIILHIEWISYVSYLRGKRRKYWREELCYFVKNMICASNWRLFRSKTWSVLRIDDFFVRNHDLCFEFKTFSFEIMICASNSLLFRSKSWTVLGIQDFFVRNHELCFEFKTFSFKIMNYASNSRLFRSKSWTVLRNQDFFVRKHGKINLECNLLENCTPRGQG